MTPVEPCWRKARTERVSGSTASWALPCCSSAKPALLSATGLSSVAVAAGGGVVVVVVLGAVVAGAVVAGAVAASVVPAFAVLALALAFAFAFAFAFVAAVRWPAGAAFRAADRSAVPVPLSRPPTAMAIAEAATSSSAATTPTADQCRRGGGDAAWAGRRPVVGGG